jgi:hypothetical protein
LRSDQLEIARWTYQLGRFLAPTLEAWEIGFMRDTTIEQELMVWLRFTNTFTRFLASHGRDPQTVTSDEGKELLGAILTLSERDEVPAKFGMKAETVAEVKRLLNDPESRLFPEAFLAQVASETDRATFEELNREFREGR